MPASKDVDIVILPSGGLIDNVAHMIAALVYLADHGFRVVTTYLEQDQHHAALICDTLSCSRSCLRYDRLERVVEISRRRPLIACAVYPDPTIPAQALKALALGVPTLLGPVGRQEQYRAALADMSVVFWEDARDVGQALARLASERDNVVRRYNEAVAAQDLAGKGSV